MRIRHGAALLASVLLASGLARAQPLPTAPVLPLDLAERAAAAAVASCTGQSYRVSVVVVDADGVMRAVLRGDGAGAHTVDSAFRKAFTAASFRTPTGALAERVAASPDLVGLRFLPNVMILGGGLPIRAGDALVGGIGTAGAPGGDKDEACAKAGIEAIGERLR